MKLMLLVAVAAFTQASFADDKTCLRTDNIDQIRMTGSDTAVATDRTHRAYDIVFGKGCGARHPNVFFIIKPDFLPTCITPGTILPTNREGNCLVKKVAAAR